jgi:valyl-tRNA synthetase
LNDLDRSTEFVTLAFGLADGRKLRIATTRPELLPACVAVFVHPEDERYADLVGKQAEVPLFGQKVTILPDPEADPEKGTGAVMCCTFGDQADVAWWYKHKLPLIEAINHAGKMTAAADDLAGLPLVQARKQVKQALEKRGFLLDRQPVEQSVRVHERCDTPVEYIVGQQWFVRVLDNKQALLDAGEQVRWHPEYMRARYRAWVENLNWDWAISRQRYFGVPFPVWYCKDCGEVLLADESQLPVDPLSDAPSRACNCGSTEFEPEIDVMDTWATSSMSPQIVGGWLDQPELYQKVFPMSMRPQAHEIIRTWAFYTIVKSFYHFGQLPWKDVFISGWGLAGEGMGKISKSRGGGPMPPMEMIERYSADAVRYWAASTGPGKDAIISEEKIQMGGKLVTKLWNVARFSQGFLTGFQPPNSVPQLTLADRWILACTQQLTRRVTEAFQEYEYATAKSEIESFFWRDLADNYLEMAKQRLYDPAHPAHAGARLALYNALRAVLKLLAPFLPYVTESIYLEMFAEAEGCASIHTSGWPAADDRFADGAALQAGELLVTAATAVRRYKSEHSISLGTELERVQLACTEPELAEHLRRGTPDLMSVTRARLVEVVEAIDPAMTGLPMEEAGGLQIGLEEIEDES